MSRARFDARNLRAGFTFGEAVVVLAIVVVCALFVMMALPRTRESARMAGCQRNLSQIGMGLLQYSRLQERFPLVERYGPIAPGADASRADSPLRSMLATLQLPDFTELTAVDKVLDRQPKSVPGAVPVRGFVCGSDPRAASGAFPAPTLRVSGPAIGQTGGHTDGYLPSLDAPAMTGFLMPEYPGRGEYLVDGSDEMRKAVRGHIRSGVDWIKLCTTGGLLSTMGDTPTKAEFTFEEVRVAVEEADRAGIPVAAHAYGGVGLDNAIDAGVRSIEHGMLITREQADRMAEREIWLVPTLIVVEELAELAAAGELPESAARRVRELHEQSGRQVEIARAAGVRIAVGSDLVTQGRNLEELELLHRAGIPAQEVLLAATRGGAELMGLGATHGRLSPGYVFDAVLMTANPLDMTAFRNPGSIEAVFQAGRIVRSSVTDVPGR